MESSATLQLHPLVPNWSPLQLSKKRNDGKIKRWSKHLLSFVFFLSLNELKWNAGAPYLYPMHSQCIGILDSQNFWEHWHSGNEISRFTVQRSEKRFCFVAPKPRSSSKWVITNIWSHYDRALQMHNPLETTDESSRFSQVARYPYLITYKYFFYYLRPTKKQKTKARLYTGANN